jgi:hypothetical protein
MTDEKNWVECCSAWGSSSALQSDSLNSCLNWQLGSQLKSIISRPDWSQTFWFNMSASITHAGIYRYSCHTPLASMASLSLLSKLWALGIWGFPFPSSPPTPTTNAAGKVSIHPFTHPFTSGVLFSCSELPVLPGKCSFPHSDTITRGRADIYTSFRIVFQATLGGHLKCLRALVQGWTIIQSGPLRMLLQNPGTVSPCPYFVVKMESLVLKTAMFPCSWWSQPVWKDNADCQKEAGGEQSPSSVGSPV